MENRNSCWTHRKSHNGMAYLMRLNNLFCYLCDTLGVQLACFCRYFHLVSAQHCSSSAHSHKRKNGWNCIFFDLFFILSTLCSRFNASIPSSPNAANKSTIFFRHRIETKKKAGRDREMVEIEKEKKKNKWKILAFLVEPSFALAHRQNEKQKQTNMLERIHADIEHFHWITPTC